MRAVSVSAWLLWSIGAAFAQSDRGVITGTISDPAGAVAPNARIEVRNQESGAVFEGASTATGNYTISQLPAGAYDLDVSVAGFKKFVHQNIAVSVAGTLRVDIVLEVGAITDEVTVTDQVSLLKTESGELSHNVTTEQLNQMPAITVAGGAGLGNIRNPLQVVTLLPGTLFINDNTLRVNGLPSSSHAIRIEGQDATNGFRRQENQSVQASLDSIQEVSVQVSNYAAEYGQAGGGYFNYTMKSGTNNLHASVYDYLANEALNAGTPYTGTPEGGHIRNKQRRNDYGFTLGGPIRIPQFYDGKDKSFFFFSFEQFRETLNIGTGLNNVPTEAYRRGDFSRAVLPNLIRGGQTALDSLGRTLPQNGVYDPLTQRLAPNGTTVRDLFPNNTIPAARLDSVALKIQTFLPLPRGPLAAQLINNYAVPAYDNFRHTTIPSFKMDHSVSATVKLSGYYSQTRTFSPNANGFPPPYTTAAPQDSVAHTVRFNYDQNITPFVLVHLGAGLLDYNQPLVPPPFNQSELGWAGNFPANRFPTISFLNDAFTGGSNVPLGSVNAYPYSKDIKPTFNSSLTSVRGNHTIKIGGEAIVEGLPVRTLTRTNGGFGFNAQQSGNPWENGQGLNALTGHPYASFLLGRANSMTVSAAADTRLGNHSLGFYAQDTWKATRKFTLDYGLRYDYVTLLREQYGRLFNAAFDLPNPVAANRLGTVIYEANCNCRFNSNYPHAWGPRLGAAYQINSKTVLRAGVGLAYGTAPNNAGLSQGISDLYSYTTAGYGEAAALLADGNPFARDNRFGNAPIVWPDFSPHYPNLQAPGLRPPQGVAVSIDRHAGRPPRILQWSIGLQRELSRNLVVEAAYVGNRGVWWTAPLLSGINYNALTVEGLKQNWGLDIANPADRGLLSTPISSPAVIARFPYLVNPNNVYPGFPAEQPLNQALRPYPHWMGIPPFLGPPLGVTWYDSLQVKATKRFSHGLDTLAAFTWQKELNLGVGSDTTYVTPAPNLVNDVFNRNQNKQISGFSRPFMLVVSFSYTTPGFTAGNASMKALSWAVRDWSLGGLLRYQSGQVIRSPSSNNGLFSQLRRTENPALWGGGNTFMNRIASEPLLLFDPNCKCFDPVTQLVLNPKAWSDAPFGQFGTAAAYYNDYRWQRQPQESLSLGRNFVIARDRRVRLQIRAELYNVFNRLFLPSPAPVSTGLLGGPGGLNAAAVTTRNSLGQLTAGYGFVNTSNGNGSQPRTGQLVARFSF